MKKLLLSMAVTALLLTACNQKTEDHGHDHNDGSHQHADGEEHADHATDTVSQQEFTVGTDSIESSEAHGHEHVSGEKHEH